MKSRKSVEFSERFNKRWLGYAAAGAAGMGMFATAQPAKADIIYTPASAWPVGFFPISVANNGINDFKFTVYTSIQPFQSEGHVFVNAYPGNGLEVGPLNKGAVIGPGGKFASYANLAIGYKDYGTPGHLSGPWANVSDKFLGLEFSMGGETYFGWAELSVPLEGPFTPVLHLEGYAYNSIPDQPIWAGQTSCTPEPGTLGLLALGSLGLGLWRRRKAVSGKQ